jgi:5-hydroxyisourate hydrolase-like protein (transthyretin family)
MAVVLLLAVTGVIWARIEVGGDQPISDQGWPIGSVQLANLPTRVSYWVGPPFGGGMYNFEYHAENTEQFNEALEVFAKIRAPRVELIVHNGPKKVGGSSPSGQGKRIDWTFTVWNPDSWNGHYNSPRSYKIYSSHPNFKRKVDPPKIDVYIGGGAVKWEEVKVPEYVKVIDKRPGSISPEFAGKGLVRATVFDIATQKPIEGAEIVLKKRGSGREYKEIKRGKTDEKGYCQIAHIPTGYYSIGIYAEGYVARSQWGWNNALPEFLKFKVKMACPACVKGVVLDVKGNPITGVKMRAVDILSDDGFGYPCVGEKSSVTDEEGRFEICSLPAGSIGLKCESRKLHRKGSIFDQYDVPSDGIKYVMTGTGTITGKVVDKDGKRPKGGILLELEPEGGSRIGKWSYSGNLNKEGTFEIKGIPPGKYVISTRPNPGSAKYEPNIGKVTIEGGKTYEMEILHEDLRNRVPNIIRKFLEKRFKNEP